MGLFSRIFQLAPHAPYRFAKTVQPSAGASAYAFERPSGLPLFALQGSGKRFLRQFMVTQPPQISISQAVPQAGLGGIVAGTLYMQELVGSYRDTIGP